ncbi:hypothetical protein RRG08_031768 [Elysia crispata]|uniref:Uncharacterized protein n=1 Tax=Elysia crispata TaxID=231223 RepID=A0AAE0ZKC3_9GAST|nr:hypothetical protein RRG08_031768 [Elysia crispata]
MSDRRACQDQSPSWELTFAAESYGSSQSGLFRDCTIIYNGRLKVDRICGEMEELAKHGLRLPPNMQGLTDEQIEDLKLKDEWGEKCQPSGGVQFKKDEIGCRNGQAPTPKMTEVLTKIIKEAKDMISKIKVTADELVTQKTVKEAIDILRGAVTIVYPMGLPPHEPIKAEFENNEYLSAALFKFTVKPLFVEKDIFLHFLLLFFKASLEVIEPDQASLWWAGKELLPAKKLGAFVGKNEKTKIVAKLQKRGQGAPAREPVLKRQFQGLNNIKWGPR